MRRSGDSLFSPAFAFSGLFKKQGARFAESAIVLASVFNEFKDVGSKCVLIQALAAGADADGREIARQLGLVFIHQDDRIDIHELNLALDACFTSMKAVSSRVGLYGFKEIRGVAVELAKNLVEMSVEIRKMLEMISLGTGVQEAARRTAKIREEAERFLLLGLGELYEQPDVRSEVVLETVKWSQIYDRFEEALDRAGRTAQTIERIALKRL
jgi:uncharacterized protein Yka (UPF0111/DUF47 family)